jgi:adenine deaminase
MARYSASGTQALQATDDDSTDATALTVAAQSTAHRNSIYEIWFGNIGAPADLVSVYTVSRITAATTTAVGTTVTPTLLDMADRASQSKCLENCTTEPTYTANQELLEVPLNHRATFRWVAAPGGEIITPATNNFGAGFKAIHASAVTLFRMGAMWEE